MPTRRPAWMTPEWIEGRKAKLLAERDRLRGSIEKESDLLGVMGTTDPREPGDLAQEDREDREVAGSIDVAQTSFQAVEEALDRIEKGTYGRCGSCGGWITKERLDARPSAQRCLPCQEAFERSQEEAPKV